MENRLDQLLVEVRGRVSPTREDRKRVAALARTLEQKVAASAKKRGIEAKVRVEGSVAKDTWLREEPDLDVFMCLPPTVTRKQLSEDSLDIAREATKGSRQVERFAEHPYLEAYVDGFRVNIVPCYSIKRGKWLSATDRTPFHTNYMRKMLNRTLREEVRLLKKFMQCVDVYGAEIKIGGFSGYLCELLTLHYKSFVQTLHAFANCTTSIVIDLENYYEDRERDLRLLFTEPLVVIDPVDKGRNVASAVQPQKIHTFVGAARAFLNSPSAKFFFRPERKALAVKALEKKLGQRGSAIVFLTFKAIEAVPDVLWGQYYRTQRSLRKLFEISDFRVLRDAAWTDEEKLSALVFELEQRTIPKVKRHVGPPLERKTECGDFLAKYVDNIDVVSGPYIENGRWVVELPRKIVDAVDLLREKLKDGGKNSGIAELVSKAIEEGFSITVNEEIVELYQRNQDFEVFLTEFLDGKPFWLETAET